MNSANSINKYTVMNISSDDNKGESFLEPLKV